MDKNKNIFFIQGIQRENDESHIAVKIKYFYLNQSVANYLWQ
ncbi:MULTISPECIES: hypothetical protein [Tatumella]|uniref:Uncharacterized protein n=1 Tax=Tatumella ptyseos ATCC 33301 TaxID=1005995 RepID=A0A085JKT1_9GAMM|nr:MULTISPECIES: hypothetical protein [Tatumella]KFD21077.1 hypothetical protein GTPT_1019 [Tatumella ptyseos ATCC 33301]